MKPPTLSRVLGLQLKTKGIGVKLQPRADVLNKEVFLTVFKTCRTMFQRMG